MILGMLPGSSDHRRDRCAPDSLLIYNSGKGLAILGEFVLEGADHFFDDSVQDLLGTEVSLLKTLLQPLDIGVLLFQGVMFEFAFSDFHVRPFWFILKQPLYLFIGNEGKNLDGIITKR